MICRSLFHYYGNLFYYSTIFPSRRGGGRDSEREGGRERPKEQGEEREKINRFTFCVF
jgi:hypothetical protein